MPWKGVTWCFIISLLAAGAAYSITCTDLLGAKPAPFASSAEYPYPPPPCELADDPQSEEKPPKGEAPPAEKDKEKSQAKGEEAEPTPPVAPADGKGKKSSDPRFPREGKPKGLDRYLRESLKEICVLSGDSLSKIGKRFHIPYTLVKNLNGLEGSQIAAGSTLKVIEGPFHLLVIRARRVLRLYCKGTWVKTYDVAVGKKGHETVLGEFTIRTKMREPSWTHPDTREVIPFGNEENPLGTRWIGFTEGIGIHGTWDPESIGQAASRGCVRMRNADVEELFHLVVRTQSVVKIVDDLPSEAEEEAGERKTEEIGE
ncbi:MAG: L,D-transpeptidase family protein, partial [Planctomycetota bacterium]